MDIFTNTSRRVAALTLLIFSIGCGEPQPPYTEILFAKVHQEGEPSGFRGRAIELRLNRVLHESSNVYYEIAVRTLEGSVVAGKGHLTTSRTYDNPSTQWMLNAYGWVRRHDKSGLRDTIRDEVKPGNIAELTVTLIDRREGSFHDPVVLAARTFHGL